MKGRLKKGKGERSEKGRDVKSVGRRGVQSGFTRLTKNRTIIQRQKADFQRGVGKLTDKVRREPLDLTDRLFANYLGRLLIAGSVAA